jgi:hypothetical protein
MVALHRVIWYDRCGSVVIDEASADDRSSDGA